MELDEAIHSCQVALGFNRLQQLWGLRTNLTKVDYHHFFGSTLYCNPFLWNKFQSFVVYTLQPFHSLTDWQTWRPRVSNVCTYIFLQMDSWFPKVVCWDLDLSTLDQPPTPNSTTISPENFSHGNVPSFPLSDSVQVALLMTCVSDSTYPTYEQTN